MGVDEQLAPNLINRALAHIATGPPSIDETTTGLRDELAGNASLALLGVGSLDIRSQLCLGAGGHFSRFVVDGLGCHH